MQHPVTPDGRYFVVRGRLWRPADPSLPEDRRQQLVGELMSPAVPRPPPCGPGIPTPSRPRADVDGAKRALGERGPAWWRDGEPDLNRRMAASRPYAAWYAALGRS